MKRATHDTDSNALDFLSGGGEMGALIRCHDWAATPLGTPETWPQSLRSALSICLHSSFPTAIYWGLEQRLLYNDAWAPIPAERHPWALGRPSQEVWADIWEIVGGQFEYVMQTGEGYATYDQMLPMVRLGVATETYWNYSFTPIRGEDGSVAGIFNQGHETTDRVLAERRAVAERERLRRMFDQAPGFMTMLQGPEHVFELANAAYLQLIGNRDVLGKPARIALPEIEAQGFFDILHTVYATGEPYVGTALPMDIRRVPDAPFERRFVDLVYQPITGPDGAVAGIFTEGYDVTERVRAEADLRESEARLRFMSGLADRLRVSRDAHDAMRAAAEHLMQHLDASRTAYADVDGDGDRFIIRDDFTAPGVASSAGVYSLDRFGPRAAAAMRSGRTLVIRDVVAELAPDAGREMFLAIGVVAIICCPLIRDGRLVAMMAVHQIQARDWLADEIAIVEAAVERCWAHVERVGAEARLRELNETLEQRVTEALAERKVLADLFETTSAFVQILDRDYVLLAINQPTVAEYEKLYSVRPVVGDNLLELLAHCPEQRELVVVLWERALAGEAFGEVGELGDPRFGAIGTT